MKKFTISAAILFSLFSGIYFANNLISSENINSKECPCTLIVNQEMLGAHAKQSVKIRSFDHFTFNNY